MAGGIQPGQVAMDEQARTLDKDCKILSEDIERDLRFTYPGLVRKKKLSQKDIGCAGACAPDGGAWFYKGLLIAVVEGKKQQNAGNAIERWFKNNHICRKINPNVSYVTFCVGPGAVENGVIPKTLAVAHPNGFNKYVPGGDSCYLNPEGFTKEEINSIMRDVIVERIEANS